jgi:hypothetical protein
MLNLWRNKEFPRTETAFYGIATRSQGSLRDTEERAVSLEKNRDKKIAMTAGAARFPARVAAIAF